MRRAFVISVVLLLALTGCATKQQIADQIEKGSLATEDANNRLMLLNIVRAYHRYPMHFARINVLRGPMGLGGPTVTLPTPFGPDFTSQIYNLSTTVKFDQPNFDFQPLDSQEFYQGMTTPIKPALMQYFLEQGWPQQLILFLFVREIEEFDKEGGRTGHWLNYPEGAEAFNAFSGKLAEFLGCEWSMQEERTPVTYGPPIELAPTTSPEKLAAIKTAGLDVVTSPRPGTSSLYQIQTVRKTLKLKLTPVSATETCTFLNARSRDEKNRGQAVSALIKSVDGKGGADLVFTLRSVEAVHYYLGELARRQIRGTRDGGSPGVHLIRYQGARNESFGKADARPQRDGLIETSKRSAEPLFVMQVDSGDSAAVAVSYDGMKFSIPKGPGAGQSMHVLSLLTQLVALQNKGTEQPTTQPVHVVNP